jgi:hypothetical protein
VNLASGAISHVAALAADLTVELFDYALQLGLAPMAYALDGARDEVILVHGGIANEPTRRYLDSVAPYHRLVRDDQRALRAQGALSMIVLDAPERIAELFDGAAYRKPEVTSYPGRSAYSRGLGVGEITSTRASKAWAARKLAEDRGLGVGDVVAFGDNLNDLPLLEMAGAAMAPVDAHPDVLARIAGRMPATSDEGVAEYLERVLAEEA